MYMRRFYRKGSNEKKNISHFNQLVFSFSTTKYEISNLSNFKSIKLDVNRLFVDRDLRHDLRNND